MSRKQFHYFCIIILALFLSGCVDQGGVKPVSEMNAKEKLVLMFDVYNTQFNEYQRVTGYNQDMNGKWVKMRVVDLSEDQRTVLAKKKEILTQIYPLIVIYDSYVSGGGTVDQSTEAQIFTLMDSLVALVAD